jgi:hypothetical protein
VSGGGHWIYPCFYCRKRIALADVEYAAKISENALRIVYRCECANHVEVFDKTYGWSLAATERLFEPFVVTLPYRAAGALPFSDDTDPAHIGLVAHMEWEVEQLASAEEFLLLTSWPPPPRERTPATD